MHSLGIYSSDIFFADPRSSNTSKGKMEMILSIMLLLKVHVPINIVDFDKLYSFFKFYSVGRWQKGEESFEKVNFTEQ